jgi:hypothetical protein
MNKRLMTVVLALSFLLSACATALHSSPSPKAREFPHYTNDYVIAIYYGFDENGHMNKTRHDANGNEIPNGMLTHMESVMIDESDRYCTQVVDQVSGRFGYDLKNTVRFGVLEGLGGAVGGVAGFPGMSFKSFFEEIGGGGAGGGLAGSEMTWEEGLRIVHSYCVMTIVQKNSSDVGDSRLKQIMILPLVAGHAVRPGNMPNDGFKFVRKNSNDPKLTAETTVGPPIVPIP